MEKLISYAKEVLTESKDNRSTLASTLFEVVRKAATDGHSISLRVDVYGISVMHGALCLGPALCRTTDDLEYALQSTISCLEQLKKMGVRR